MGTWWGFVEHSTGLALGQLPLSALAVPVSAKAREAEGDSDHWHRWSLALLSLGRGMLGFVMESSLASLSQTALPTCTLSRSRVFKSG